MSSEKNRKRMIQLAKEAAKASGAEETAKPTPVEQRKLQETLKQDAAAKEDAEMRAAKEARSKEILAQQAAEAAPKVDEAAQDQGGYDCEFTAEDERVNEEAKAWKAPTPADAPQAPAAPAPESNKQRKAREKAEREAAAKAKVDAEAAQQNS